MQIGFYLHRVRRPPARSEDGKNLDGCDSARVFGTQRSRIRGDWVVSIQRLPMHWSLRGYIFFSALRADEKGVCICVYNRN